MASSGAAYVMLLVSTILLGGCLKKTDQKVAFRVDASSKIGTGHFMRCLTLADGLKQRGAQIRFVSRYLPEHLRSMLAAKNQEFVLLDSNQNDIGLDELAHSHWLGVSQMQDAQDTIRSLSDETWDWLIVDHYALDERWESALRRSARCTMVIDDIADRKHDCDILLDQNYYTDMAIRYAGKVPDRCKTLLGSEYALLQSDYAELHERVPPREGPIRCVFIYFGGTDTDNLTGRSISAFLSLNRPNIEVDVVVSPSSPHVEAIRKQVEGHANIHLHDSLPTLAPLMTKADIAIGAGGSTSWERLCMGLPAIVISLAENQRSIAEELHHRSVIRWLGHKDGVAIGGIAKELKRLIDQGMDREWSQQCFKLVDGKGVKRVGAALMVSRDNPLRARYAMLEDEALLLEWANDPETRRNSFSSAQITKATHHKWFNGRLSNLDEYRLYIIETTDSVPVGQVRFERSGEAWEVHYLLSPLFRHRGLGRALLEVGLLQLGVDERSAHVFGRVKRINEPSRKIFENLGFNAVPCDSDSELLVYRNGEINSG